MYSEADLRKAFKAGWDQRNRTVSIIQPTNARQEFYGEKARHKASVRRARYHHSLFAAWLKEEK